VTNNYLRVYDYFLELLVERMFRIQILGFHCGENVDYGVLSTVASDTNSTEGILTELGYTIVLYLNPIRKVPGSNTFLGSLTGS
jgi:hypothetical protein